MYGHVSSANGDLSTVGSTANLGKPTGHAFDVEEDGADKRIHASLLQLLDDVVVARVDGWRPHRQLETVLLYLTWQMVMRNTQVRVQTLL